jgi:predicted Zn-dependent protease
VADFLRLPIIVGYAKYQEAEADENGMTLAFEAGYDPRAMVEVMKRFEKITPDPTAPQAPSGPVTEAASATADTIEVYLRSHPLNYERVEDLSELIASDRRWHGSREVYEGVENYREHVAMSTHRFAGESEQW